MQTRNDFCLNIFYYSLRQVNRVSKITVISNFMFTSNFRPIKIYCDKKDSKLILNY